MSRSPHRRDRSRSPRESRKRGRHDRHSEHRRETRRSRSPERSRRRRSRERRVYSRFDELQAKRRELPIFEYRQELLDTIRDNQVLVCIGETGSGKTTQLPQFLHECGEYRRGVIGVTQPRRVAATSVARRVSEEMGTHVGRDVGYHVRFDHAAGPETRIKFLTDGCLIRECLADPDLSAYSVLVLDEAHERTINTDVLLGLVKRVLPRRPELKLVVMSATLQTEKFSRFFGNCCVFTVPGRTFDVDVFHAHAHARVKASNRDALSTAVTDLVMRIHAKEGPGHVLAFLTGQDEIRRTVRAVREAAEAEAAARRRAGEAPPAPMLVLPLFGALSAEQQAAVFEEPPPGTRKVVISTNICETSVTIDGVRYVIDPGYVKEKQFDARAGMDALEVVTVSRTAAIQRAGRAGRTGPGKCYRLYPSATFERMARDTVPEIQRSDLASVVLQLKALGVVDVLSFEFLDPPSSDALRHALVLLHLLGAVDADGRLTPRGHAMARFPLEPRLSRTLMAASDGGCGRAVATIAAMLSTESVFVPRPRPDQEGTSALDAGRYDAIMQAFAHRTGDHMTLLTVFEAWEAAGRDNKWCTDRFLHARALHFASKARLQLIDALQSAGLPVGEKRSSRAVRKALCEGFFMNSATMVPSGAYKTMGDPAFPILALAHPSSAVVMAARGGGDESSDDARPRGPPFVLFHEVVRTSRAMLRNVSEIDPAWVRDKLHRLDGVDVARLSGRTDGSAETIAEARRAAVLAAREAEQKAAAAGGSVGGHAVTLEAQARAAAGDSLSKQDLDDAKARARARRAARQRGPAKRER